MLFNTYTFIFLFFPAAMGLCFAIARYGRNAQLFAILATSLFFYGWWNVRFLPLLLLSITGNYLVGRQLARNVAGDRQGAARAWLAAGVTLNLVVLGVFKYANFFVQNVNLLADTHYTLGAIILPLGISFFTFEQISYLADIKHGHVYRADPLAYAVFVSFFPRLVAGPILRYGEIEPQLRPGGNARVSAEDVAVGLTIFFIGLCKKSLLADSIAPHAQHIFAVATNGGPIDFFAAWGGVLAYTCQLYFDFSGYSDMAIGAARCFGLHFPVNFASPYKARNITEFWRRWHMTLSRFLRDYLYISLGGNRRGKLRRYANLFITMLLGGLWHGANWTFVCWGALHGFYLMINHGWDAVANGSASLTKLRRISLWRGFSAVLTFVAVVVGWVFFRSPDFSTAARLLSAMAGMQGAIIPDGLSGVLGPLHGLFAHLGITFGGGSGTALLQTYSWVIALLVIAFALPNTQELMARFDPALLPKDMVRTMGLWSLSKRWAVAAGAFAFIGVLSITRVSEFLYWQF